MQLSASLRAHPEQKGAFRYCFLVPYLINVSSLISRRMISLLNLLCTLYNYENEVLKGGPTYMPLRFKGLSIAVFTLICNVV